MQARIPAPFGALAGRLAAAAQAWAERLRRSRATARAYGQLAALDDRTIADLGLRRSELSSLCAEVEGRVEVTREAACRQPPTLRAAQPGDLPALHGLVRGLSPASRTQRFFAPLRELPRQMAAAIERRDPAHRFVVAQAEAGLVALGQLAIEAGTSRGELALVVADPWQSRGLGRRLLEHLLDQAAGAGVRQVAFETLSHNVAMRRLALRCGVTLRVHPDDARLLQGERALG